MSQNADTTYAWKLLASTLRAEISQLEAADREISRLQAKKGEAASRIALLEAAT